MDAPKHIDLKKDRGLTIAWDDGQTSYYSIAYLRKMSPSAEARQLREEMARNPLTILPSTSSRTGGGPLVALGAELVGNYALRITFSDGHDTGIYSWGYLRKIDPQVQEPGHGPPQGE
jgi:DUF971 family protein